MEPTTEGAAGAAPAPDGPAGVVASDATVVPVPGAPVAGGLAGAAAALGAPVIPVPVGGPGVGAARVAEATVSVTTRALEPRGEDPRGPVADDRSGTSRDDVFGRIPARAAPVFDPDDVPGSHVLEALTTIEHDGQRYRPGDQIDLDFRSYEQLVSIGAVGAIEWSTGRPIRLR